MPLVGGISPKGSKEKTEEATGKLEAQSNIINR